MIIIHFIHPLRSVVLIQRWRFMDGYFVNSGQFKAILRLIILLIYG